MRLLFVVAAAVAILLGFSPKFAALTLSIPDPVIVGLSIVLFGLITAMAGQISVENSFSNPRNLRTVAAALTDTLKFGDFTMRAIGTA